LRQIIFARQLLVIGHEAGHGSRRIAHQIVDTLELREVRGKPAVDRAEVNTEKAGPRGAVSLQNSDCRSRFRLRARGFSRQGTQKIGADPPAPGKLLSRLTIVGGHRIVAAEPSLHCLA
jgi:hypothetical protein